MKTISSLVILFFVFAVSGCSTVRPANPYDAAMTASLAPAIQACYDAQKASVPDMQGWTAEQIIAYENASGMKAANAKLAAIANHESLDPCAKAGGTNFYDSQNTAAKVDAEISKYWLEMGKSILTTALYGYIAHEAFGYLKEAGSGTKVYGNDNELTGVGNKGDKWSIDKTSTINQNTDSLNSYLGDSAIPTEPVL